MSQEGGGGGGVITSDTVSVVEVQLSGQQKEKQAKEEEFENGEGGHNYKQCLSVNCTNAARSRSKYCSQQCCIQLATDRLNLFMPAHFQNYKSSLCVAELRNRDQLRTIQGQLTVGQNTVKNLEEKRMRLEKYIMEVEKLKVEAEQEGEKKEDPQGDEGTAGCISCGRELPHKKFIKHMEQCFLKFESNRYLASNVPPFRSRGSGLPIFCDAYNPLDATYCRKFHSLCSKHEAYHKKTAIIQVGDILCGFPTNMENPSMEGMCRSTRLQCCKHFWWERVQRAAMDLERLKGWSKLDDLMLEMSHIRQAMHERGSVLGILLHTTHAHDPTNLPDQAKAFLKKEEEYAKQKRLEKEATEKVEDDDDESEIVDVVN